MLVALVLQMPLVPLMLDWASSEVIFVSCRSWLSGASDEEGSSSSSEGRVPSPPASDMEGSSLLDTVLLAEWEDRAEQGLFRYDVTACPTKVVPGAYGFVAQFNEGRGSKKRPTEFRVDKVCLLS